MELFIIGLVVALNFIIIKMKLDKKRFEDAIFDLGLLILITMVLQGSYAGIIVGTVASLCISIYFLASPPQFFGGNKGIFEEFKRRAKRGSVLDI